MNMATTMKHDNDYDIKLPIESFRKQFIHELNALRRNPQNYSTVIRSYEKYFDDDMFKIPNTIPIKTQEGVEPLMELAMILDSLDSMCELIPCEGLNQCTMNAVELMQSFDQVIQVYDMKIDELLVNYGEVYGPFAQCCDFGTNNPQLLLLILLMDDGDSNRPNRTSLLNPNFKMIGLSQKTHRKFAWCSIIMLARHFYSLVEKPLEGSDNEEDDFVTDKQYYSSKTKNNYRKTEKVVEENGTRKKLVKVTKLRNGELITEIFKERV